MEAGARTEADRVAIVRNHEVGVIALDAGTTLVARDLTIRDTAGQESDGRYGGGLVIQEGALGEVTRALIEANRDVGATAREGSALILEEVVVRDTRERDCVTGGCAGLGSGIGVGAYTLYAVIARVWLLPAGLGGYGASTAPIPLRQPNI